VRWKRGTWAAVAGVSAVLAAGAGVVAAVGPVRGSPGRFVAQRPLGSRAGAAVHRSAPAPSTVPGPLPVATTAAPVDPGSLPQTDAEPTADDVTFQLHVDQLWRAVVDGDPLEAMAFFFPLGAYVQVKGISDPVHDYDTRLVPDFDADVLALHRMVPPGATYLRVSVPTGQAQWILPGTEYNKGSYWRVYGTTVWYRTPSGRTASFPITSMISWRGEWYVVHLGAIR